LEGGGDAHRVSGFNVVLCDPLTVRDKCTKARVVGRGFLNEYFQVVNAPQRLTDKEQIALEVLLDGLLDVKSSDSGWAVLGRSSSAASRYRSPCENQA
jgi:high-affinity K+ transport system ATPase subunit B